MYTNTPVFPSANALRQATDAQRAPLWTPLRCAASRHYIYIYIYDINNVYTYVIYNYTVHTYIHIYHIPYTINHIPYTYYIYMLHITCCAVPDHHRAPRGAPLPCACHLCARGVPQGDSHLRATKGVPRKGV